MLFNHPFTWHDLPVVNASLNAAAALLLLAAFVMVKRRNYIAHASLMILALITSAVFLTCYLTYHTLKARHGETISRFPIGPWHGWYIALLLSHTILAVVILPLITMSLVFATSRKWLRHKSIASITFPLWFYVSVTGVVVYWMLYHLAPTLRH